MKSAEEIYKLITKQISGELSASEQEELNAWLEESSNNRDLMEQFGKVWDLTQPRKSIKLNRSIDDEWHRLRKKLEFDDENIIEFPKKSGWIRYLSIAAALIAIVSTVFWYTKDSEDTYEIAETQNAATKELRLADGSFIHMNNATQIRYRKNHRDSVRLVFLKGEAFFEVEKNEKPFIVQTDIGRVRVLGTQFNIWSRKKETRVFVHEGKVSLTINRDSGSPQSTEISANQLAIANESLIEDITEIQNSDRLIGWREGRIVFNRTELVEVAEELERIFDQKIKLEQEDLGSLSITANFHKKPVKDILEAVCLALDLKFRPENNGFVIYQ